MSKQSDKSVESTLSRQEKVKLEKLVQSDVSIPLSDSAVMKLLKGKTKILMYRDLDKIHDIEQLLNPYNSFVLLYETLPNIGHWVCVIRSKHNLVKEGLGNRQIIEFFDPYGKMMDTQQAYIDPDYIEVSGQNNKKLSELLLKSNPKYIISFNNHSFQKTKKEIKTCGRWVCTRIIHKDIPLDEFKSIFLSPNSDNIVTLMTT